MSSSAGPVTVILGASRGIGAAAAIHLGSIGHRLILASRTTSNLEAVAKAVTDAGGAATVVAVDVTKEDTIQTAFATAVSTYGRPAQFVFANAGVELIKPLEALESKDLDLVFNVNVKGSFLAAKHAINAFKSGGGGVFVAVSSIASKFKGDMFEASSSSAFATYAASKAAVDVLARGFKPYEKEGIRGYVISPGAFDTSMADRAAKSFGAPAASSLSSLNPIHKATIGKPRDIGVLLETLYTDKDREAFPSGTNIAVDNDTAFNASELSKVVDLPGDWGVIDRAAWRNVSGGEYSGEVVEVTTTA